MRWKKYRTKEKVNKKILFAGIFIFVLCYSFAQNDVRELFRRYAAEYADKPKKEISPVETGRDGVLFCFDNAGTKKWGSYYKLNFFGSMRKVEYTVIDESAVRYIHEKLYTYQESYTTENAEIIDLYYEMRNDRIVSFDSQGRIIKNEPEIKEKLQAILKTLNDASVL